MIWRTHLLDVSQLSYQFLLLISNFLQDIFTILCLLICYWMIKITLFSSLTNFFYLYLTFYRKLLRHEWLQSCIYLLLPFALKIHYDIEVDFFCECEYIFFYWGISAGSKVLEICIYLYEQESTIKWKRNIIKVNMVVMIFSES